MGTAPFAPRTIAAARTERSRHLAPHLRRLGRRIASGTVDGCAALARAWRRHEELMDMLHLDDRLLHDIGVKRSEILAAVRERRWTRAALHLVATAVARRHEGRADVRSGISARVPRKMSLSVASRSSGHPSGADQRPAA